MLYFFHKNNVIFLVYNYIFYKQDYQDCVVVISFAKLKSLIYYFLLVLC